MYFLIIKINNFRGDLSDISANISSLMMSLLDKVVGGRVFDIAGVPPNMYIVVYIS